MSPNLTFHAHDDGKVSVFMHLDQKLRAMFGLQPETIAAKIESVGISEFGMTSDEVKTLVANAMKPVEPAAPPAPVVSPADFAALDRRLSDETAKRLKAESDLRMAQNNIAGMTDELVTGRARIEELENKLAMISPADLTTHATPEPGIAAVTEAGVQTPPPEPSAAHVETGAAPTSAAAGETGAA